MTLHKRWTYRQITDKAEKRIRALMAEAAEAPHLAHYYHEQARGVLNLWNDLTRGGRANSDSRISGATEA
ncbi:hypothetical protein X942_6508 [Burkholderia pseudomallei MSHR5596]|uniref:Uncharacterized protein n=1 Tax=Burkholderia pseudomallei TaxID=28450 RepID=A0AA40MFB4_BURPE|nr:hypothetical protein X942_6508 [Burkholderia pseudomallei MSHR5596]KGX17038.1 hypothetical protein Y036_6177 [Burkholderia pseudomallei]